MEMVSVAKCGFAQRMSPKLVVGIATTGRAPVLLQMIEQLAKQTVAPDRIIISAISEEDYAGTTPQNVPIKFVTTGRGLAQQRNRIIDLLERDEVVIFFDDDFVPCSNFLERTLRIFQSDPEIALVTGTVIKDGILGPGLKFSEAVAIVSSAPSGFPQLLTDVYNGYGCNMAIRAKPVLLHGLRFDENLPLYSWLEDVDFSRQLSSYGRLVRASDVQGVHMGVKSGRTSGVKFGYSQVVNPLYLYRKGTITTGFALKLISRNIGANLVKSLAAESYIDRVGRLRGNMLGIVDVLFGRADPTRTKDIR